MKIKTGNLKFKKREVGSIRFNRHRLRRCNLCSYAFSTRTVFDRYCPSCKNRSELLKFSDWLPELDPSFESKVSA
jgi:hypothetical protein